MVKGSVSRLQVSTGLTWLTSEMFASGSVVASWDNSTRGLDASTALDYAKSLRLLTDIMQQTTFVSLYQAGEGIYQQFDKVLVLNDGHVVYYGPATEARKYMVSLGYQDLPRQTTADYLTGCTDLNERRFAEGKDAKSVPSSPEGMEKAYRESEIYQREIAEKEAYQKLHTETSEARDEFRQAVAEQKHRVSTRSIEANFRVSAKSLRTLCPSPRKFGPWPSVRPSCDSRTSSVSTLVTPRL